ncbi:MAG: nicotinate (nicotinamide) nucleotide adenylyltransferase [Candidatus Cloacimonetes bacterium]|nr:nicotinate (nicotinamide) nucleotide adenylyltransferase [Candidatus Cloacimonadota bacterium]
MKTAILGGSFNPIHNGHLYIAKKALEALNIDKVLFVPVGIHHFKESTELTPYEIRVQWVMDAIADYPEFQFSGADAPEFGKSYTKNLYLRLKKQYPNDEFTFLAGADIISSLSYWYDSEWLLQNVEFAIFTRPGADNSSWNKLPFLDKIRFFEIEGIDVSSTEIRQLIQEKRSIKGLVPEQIEASITRYFLLHTSI